MFRNLFFTVITILGIFTGPLFADDVVVEYKTSDGNYNLSLYGYLKNGLLIDLVDISNNPYLLGGYTRKIGPIHGEILGGLVYNQQESYVGNAATDLIVYGSFKNLFALVALEVAPGIKDDGWIFTKTALCYKQFGILITSLTPEDIDTIVKLGPTISWSWKNYGKLTTAWMYNFSNEVGKLCFQYKKTISF